MGNTPGVQPPDDLSLLEIQLADLRDFIQQQISDLASLLASEITAAIDLGHAALDKINAALGAIKKALGALAHLHWADIWKKLRAFYDRFRRLLKWYQKYVQAPLDRLRRQLDAIYRQIFGPIIKVIDTVRLPLRILAVFNRKLAAVLDQRLWSLESKILGPLLTAYRRLNALSSVIRAKITQAGFFDRVTLVESVRRDASLILRVLTNPRDVISSPVPSSPGKSLADLSIDFSVYVKTGGGPMADTVAALDAVSQETLLHIS